MNTHRASRGSARGATTLEFQIISVMVLIPLLMGMMQMGMFMIAKNTMNAATLAAARAGAASGGDKAAMKHALAVGLAPLFSATGKRAAKVGMGDITKKNYAEVMGAALGVAKADSAVFGSIDVLNPTAASFKDFGIKGPDGTRVIPVTNVMDNNAVGTTSKQTRADALLLKIEARYCYKMVFPLIDQLVTGVLNAPFSGASLADRACYAVKRVPIVSQAVVRITVPPVQSALLK